MRTIAVALLAVTTFVRAQNPLWVKDLTSVLPAGGSEDPVPVGAATLLFASQQRLVIAYNDAAQFGEEGAERDFGYHVSAMDVATGTITKSLVIPVRYSNSTIGLASSGHLFVSTEGVLREYSADLDELRRVPITEIVAGAKINCDVPRNLSQKKGGRFTWQMRMSPDGDSMVFVRSCVWNSYAVRIRSSNLEHLDTLALEGPQIFPESLRATNEGVAWLADFPIHAYTSSPAGKKIVCNNCFGVFPLTDNKVLIDRQSSFTIQDQSAKVIAHGGLMFGIDSLSSARSASRVAFSTGKIQMSGFPIKTTIGKVLTRNEVWDISSAKLVASFKKKQDFNSIPQGSVESLAISDDGRLLAILSARKLTCYALP